MNIGSSRHSSKLYTEIIENHEIRQDGCRQNGHFHVKYGHFHVKYGHILPYLGHICHI